MSATLPVAIPLFFSFLCLHIIFVSRALSAHSTLSLFPASFHPPVRNPLLSSHRHHHQNSEQYRSVIHSHKLEYPLHSPIVHFDTNISEDEYVEAVDKALAESVDDWENEIETETETDEVETETEAETDSYQPYEEHVIDDANDESDVDNEEAEAGIDSSVEDSFNEAKWQSDSDNNAESYHYHHHHRVYADLDEFNAADDQQRQLNSAPIHSDA